MLFDTLQQWLLQKLDCTDCLFDGSIQVEIDQNCRFSAVKRRFYDVHREQHIRVERLGAYAIEITKIELGLESALCRLRRRAHHKDIHQYFQKGINQEHGKRENFEKRLF